MPPGPRPVSTLTDVVDIDLLQDVQLLAELTDDEMARLAASAVTARYLRGDVVFAEDAEPDRLYVVASGRIAIAKRSVDGRESMVALMEREMCSARCLSSTVGSVPPRHAPSSHPSW